MTNATDSKVTREMYGSDGRVYAVTLCGAGVLIRERGKRQAFPPVPVGAVYSVAAKLEVLAQTGSMAQNGRAKRNQRR
jgi:hypothetical protein